MKCISCGMRLTGLLLTFVLILSLFAAGTASADAAPEMGCGLAEQTVTIVEPKLVQRRGGIDDSEYHTDIQSAGEELRTYLKNHEDGSVKFKYSCDTDFGDVVRAIYSAAVAHTGDPQEGDAIRWATNGYHAGASGYTDYEYNYYTISFDVGYYTTPEQEAELTAAVDALIEQFDFDWDADEFEKVKTVYDYVCGHVEYDYANLENSGYTLKYTAYAAMINGTSVCQGYALLMYRLLLEVGVDCRLISGTGNGGGHAWNIVKLGDRYYNIDSTWDAVRDPYEYFLRSESEFGDHARDDEFLTEEFHAAYPMSGTSHVMVPDGMRYSISNGQVTIKKYSGAETEVVIPDEISGYPVTVIGSKAFENSGITSIDIPDSVTKIDGAFSYCRSLSSVYIPAGVESINSRAFDYCSALTSIEVDPQNTVYCDVDGVVFDKSQHELVMYPAGRGGNYTVPSGVTAIGDWAFHACSNLQSVELPEGLKTIGSGAFYDCSGLKELDLPDSLTLLGGSAFAGCRNLTGAEIPEGISVIPAQAFMSCSKLESVKIPEGVTEIGASAFYFCEKLSDIKLPETLETIGKNAFCNGWALTVLEIPDGVTSIGKNAFGNCYNLQVLALPAGLTSIGQYVCQNDGKLWHVMYGGTQSRWEELVTEEVDPVLAGSTTHCEAGIELITVKKTCTAVKYICSICQGEKSVEISGGEHVYENGVCTSCGEADPDYITVVYGDANGDNEVNGKDLLMLRRYMANYDDDTKTSTIKVKAGADANGDGEVNGKDLLMLRRYMANYDDDTRTSTVVLGPR